MTILNKKDITIYKDVNKVLHSLTKGIKSIFGSNVVGIYLTGSLSYGNFNPKSSDIDLVVVLYSPASRELLELVKKLHLQVERIHKQWAQRIECSYIPISTLQSILPPELPRPYVGEGIFYPEASYGNEWLINQYLLYKHGIALIGQEFKTLIKPIDIIDVKKACIRDLFQEWQPKINDPLYLQNSHYQSYIILNMCRILYTVICNETASKKVSAAWVKKEFGTQWNNLIQAAENWHYGLEMHFQKDTIEFIKFIISKVFASQK